MFVTTLIQIFYDYLKIFIKKYGISVTSGKSSILANSAPLGYINGGQKNPTTLSNGPPSSTGPYDTH